MNSNDYIFIYKDILKLEYKPKSSLDGLDFVRQVSTVLDDAELVKGFNLASEKVLKNSDLTLKKNFISMLCRYLGIENSKYLIYLSILDFTGISNDEFSNNFPFLKGYLTSYYASNEDRLNSYIRVLMILLNSKGDILEKLKSIENELKKDFLSIISLISENPQKVLEIGKEKIIFLIKVLFSQSGFYPSQIPLELFQTLANFLERELMIGFEQMSKGIRKLGFNLARNDIIKTQDNSKVAFDEISSMVSNGNFTKNPLIITFYSFPGGKLRCLIFQQQQIFSDGDSNNVKIFNSDKKAFLEELARINSEYENDLSKGEIYSTAVFMGKGMNSTPPTNIDFSHLAPANDDVLISIAA